MCPGPGHAAKVGPMHPAPSGFSAAEVSTTSGNTAEAFGLGWEERTLPTRTVFTAPRVFPPPAIVRGPEAAAPPGSTRRVISGFLEDSGSTPQIQARPYSTTFGDTERGS